MQEDEGKGIIRIDGLVRRNVGVGLGDKVEVRKAEVLPAERITIAPIISEGHKISFGQGIENFVKRGLLKRPLNKGDVVIVPGIALMGGALPFMVISTAPKGVVQIQDDTIIEMKEEPVREGEVLTPTVTYEDIGGLKEELMKVREMIELPLKHAELFERVGIDPPNGVLLYGAPRTEWAARRSFRFTPVACRLRAPRKSGTAFSPNSRTSATASSAPTSRRSLARRR